MARYGNVILTPEGIFDASATAGSGVFPPTDVAIFTIVIEKNSNLMAWGY